MNPTTSPNKCDSHEILLLVGKMPQTIPPYKNITSNDMAINLLSLLNIPEKKRNEKKA